MKKNRAQKSLFSIKGYLIFFVLVCAVATCSILTYSLTLDLSGGNKTTTAIITLVVLIVLALLCSIIDWLRRKYTVERPVQSIIDATEQITGGNFLVKLEPQHIFGRYNEFDIIMENINRMTEELSKNELLKTDFIANVSHEIKSPLALIQSYAVGLGGESLTNEMRREYAQTLLLAAKRLSDLITNILQLSKLENQVIFPHKQRVEVGEQLRECVLSFEEQLERKNLELNCNICDIAVVSDPGYLEIIWNNLLSNAIKFTPNGGKISVALKEQNGYAVATVSDTGCGVSKEVGVHIFDKFYQADVSHSTQGNGLGLALVKRVIDVLGGDIEVSSEVGSGSTFTIRIRKDTQ